MKIPAELQSAIVDFLDPASIKSLHPTSKEMRDLTTGVVSAADYKTWLIDNDRRTYHDVVGAELWQLAKEQESLHKAYRDFKCRGKNGSGITRANVHSDFDVYDKCIRIRLDWWCGHIFTHLKGTMDTVADVDKMPLHIEGFPGSDTYYRREGITRCEPLPISDGPTFAPEDLKVILAWLTRLLAMTKEVEVWAVKISKLHNFYSKYPGSIKRIRTVLENRIRWLEAKL